MSSRSRASAFLHCVAFFLISASVVPAQTDPVSTAGVEGTVTDAVTLSPIAGAMVTTSTYPPPPPPMPPDMSTGVYQSTVTSVSGTYAFAGLPAGSYQLLVSAPGYVQQTIFPLTATSGVTTTLPVSLTPAGSITGTIDTIDGLPLPTWTMVDVSVSDLTGAFVGSTMVMGGLPASYTVQNLAAGSYRVRVSAWGSGYLDQTYPETVQVLGGQTTPNIDFLLSRGGSIAGRVFAEGTATGTPIQGASVEVTVNGMPVTLVTTDGEGRYEASGLASGDYGVAVTSAVGFAGEAYPTTVHVVTGAQTPGIDFALERTAIITGSVSTATGVVPTGVSVMAYDATGTQYKGSAWVDMMTGQFTLSIKGGAYRIWTSNWSGYIDQAYPGVPCNGACWGTMGETVTVASGDTTAINFTLQLAGGASGTVRGPDGVPLAWVTVNLTDPSGYQRIASTDPMGRYTFDRVPAGDYLLGTSNSPYLDEPGTPVTIVAGVTLQKDLMLRLGGRIAGTVYDATTHLPLTSLGIVSIFSAVDSKILNVQTGPDGTYTVAGLNAGDYFAIVNAPGYVTQLYDSLPCATVSCSASAGTPIRVVTDGTSTIDFTLQPGGRIAGQALFEKAGPYLGSAELWNSAGQAVDAVWFGYGGSTFNFNGLPAGTYYLTVTEQRHVRQLYGGGDCQVTCDVTTGTPITVVPGSATSVSVSLPGGGSISGHVTAVDAAQNPITPNSSVQVFDDEGRRVKPSGYGISPNGRYIIEGLDSGLYYLRTRSDMPLIDEVYADVPCAGECRVTSGQAVEVNAPDETTGIDFQLAAGGIVAGSITSTDGMPIASAYVHVIDASGRSVASGGTDASGRYQTVTGIPAGTYFARTTNGSGYINEAAGGETCLEDCHVSSTQAIAVVAGRTTTVDFALAKGATVSGRVTNAAGSGLGNVRVVLVNAAGAPVMTASSSSNGTFRTAGGVPAETYYARTSNSAGYVNEFFDSAPCIASCDPLSAGAAAIALNAGESRTGVNFVLEADADADGDGISNTIDLAPATASDDFADLVHFDTTDGVIAARGGWNVSVGDRPTGVAVGISGSGSAPAAVSICAASGHETLVLDAAGERALVSCSASGTATVRSIAAYPTIELRKAVGDITALIEVGWGQTASMGSPLAAASDNGRPMRIRYLDASGAIIASFELDPGEKIDAVTANGVLRIEVLVGAISIVLSGDEMPIRVREGDSIEVPVDREAPVIGAVAVAPGTLWPPDHRMVPVSLSVIASDDSGGVPSCAISSISSNEPENGTGDGDTGPDWNVSGPMTLDLRAERAGTGSGRFYTLTISCADASGNAATTTATVTVPKSQRK